MTAKAAYFLVHLPKMESITKYIVGESIYERMTEMHDDSPWASYDEFYNWNIKCLQESRDDTIWLHGFCKRLALNKINLMDEESCSTFSACGFYYDHDKNIVLVNPR